MNVQKVFYTFLFFFNFCLFCSLYAYKEVVVQDRKKEIESREKDENIKIFEKQRNMTGTASKDYLSGGIVNNTGSLKKEKESKEKLDCNKDCKIKTLIDNGIRKEIANTLVNECKISAINPVHCIKVGASIATAESGGKNCYQGGCFGIKSGGIKYKSIEEGTIDWITRYNKYWYKSNNMSFFYPKRGGLSLSRYCTSEKSSNSTVGCPNGLKHSQNMFDKLSKFF